jgi:hypothetical protein
VKAATCRLFKTANAVVLSVTTSEVVSAWICDPNSWEKAVVVTLASAVVVRLAISAAVYDEREVMGTGG